MISTEAIAAPHPLSAEGQALYRDAFARYKAQALWNMRLLESPTNEEALAVARQLRIEGDMSARFLAEAIERACRAAF